MKENKYVIGLDLGGTNAVFGLVDENYEIKATGSLLTQEYTLATAFVEDAAEVISELSSVAGGIENIKAIGIGAPCGNYNAGTIEHAANISWGKGVVPICQMLNEKTGIPVAITNDAKAAALGEMSHGAAMGMKDFIEITLGTGVGSGIVANGNLIYGSDGFAGHISSNVYTAMSSCIISAPASPAVQTSVYAPTKRRCLATQRLPTITGTIPKRR